MILRHLTGAFFGIIYKFPWTWDALKSTKQGYPIGFSIARITSIAVNFLVALIKKRRLIGAALKFR